MKRVFDCWPEIAARVRAAGSVALFLDFDGTLAPIRETPEEVRLTQPVRRAVARLAGHRRVRVWVISGRKLADVRSKTGVSGVRYLGLHGWEGRAGTGLQQETQRALDRAKRMLENQVKKLPGIWIEDKGSAFAVHYRCAGETEASVARHEIYEVAEHLNGGFRLLSGKKVWEILPREVGDKGSAVRRELTRFEPSALPIYIGDDLTDERAFLALPDGLTIRVGSHSLTRARFQLRDPGEVYCFLEKLEEELSAVAKPRPLRALPARNYLR
jgi:trehalose-phosphatase